ncbi:MAG: hypothetical protein KGL69_12770 [Alphaproteobacteria bacterium]|nr:hypothetical protein [Alphaproteobacteria bacterium]
MDIHKPKPVHSLREFLSEIAVVVCGILIALSLEQALEVWRTHERIAAGEASVREELSDQLAYATLFIQLKPGLDARIDALEAAAAAGDHAKAAQIAALPAPFLVRPWSVTAWDAAASEQIISGIAPGRRRIYEIFHRQVMSMQDLQYRVKENYAVLLGARYAAGGEAAVAQEIAAAERLRSDSALTVIIGQAMLAEGPKLGLKPTPERLQRAIRDLTKCRDAAARQAVDPRYVCG